MELSVLARQCLARRIPDIGILKDEVSTWERTRNAAVVKVEWQFTSADARIKLKKLYPTIQLQWSTSVTRKATNRASSPGQRCG